MFTIRIRIENNVVRLCESLSQEEFDSQQQTIDKKNLRT